MTIRFPWLIALCSALSLALSLEASAAALDSTFGENGRVAVDLGIRGSRANAVVVQPDGKIVAAGSSTSTADRDFMLFRLLPDGSLDPDFNHDGTVTTAVGSSDDEALSIALQPDGKVIAAGYSTSEKDRDFAIVRYSSDGSLDRSFGNEGMVVTPVGSSHDEITDVAVQPDGGIVVTGAAQGANGRVVVLGRYLADGTPDPHFAEKGFALSVVGVDAQAESVALSKDGHILVSGTYSDGQRRGLMVLNFDSSGHLNQQFGEKGVAVPTDNSTFSEGYGMVVTEEGRIVVAGSVGKEGEREAALFGFTAEGQPDSSFEQNGLLVSSAGAGDDALLDVTVAGRTLSASGFKTTGDSREFLLVTYTQGSTQENTGGSSLAMQTGGQLKADALTTGFSSGKDTSTAIAAVSSTSLVAVGESEAASGSSAAVSKYTLSSMPDSTTSTTGSLSAGNQYILTGQPYEVTRTTAIIPAEILDGLSSVTKRGIVFGSMANPVLKDSTSSSSSSSTNTGAPVITNNSASSVTGTSATLTLTTDVNATCKYGTTADITYDQIGSTFSTTGTTTHSQLVTSLTVGTSTYYARCQNTSSGTVNTADTKISFTVTASSSAAPARFQQLVAASDEEIMSNALRNVGSFFLSTAIAADTTTTSTAASTTTASATNSSSTTSDFIEEGSTSEGSGSGAFSSKLSNLKPGTFFYARTYAISGGTTYYGNQVGFRTADSCFVATAAYGSIFHPSVQILRDFRDQFLRGNAASRSLIDLYYTYSPSIADLISKHSSLRFAVRMLLLPVTGAAWLALQFGIFAVLIPAAAVVALICWLLLIRLRRNDQSCPATTR